MLSQRFSWRPPMISYSNKYNLISSRSGSISMMLASTEEWSGRSIHIRTFYHLDSRYQPSTSISRCSLYCHFFWGGCPFWPVHGRIVRKRVQFQSQQSTSAENLPSCSCIGRSGHISSNLTAMWWNLTLSLEIDHELTEMCISQALEPLALALRMGFREGSTSDEGSA